jgi:hypothetical protein
LFCLDFELFSPCRIAFCAWPYFVVHSLNPHTHTHTFRSSPCEHYAESTKHALYDADFKGTQFLFSALVFESTGGINEEGRDVLRQLFRFAAKREGIQLSVYCGRAWARLACNLQFSISQAILNRVSSVGVPDLSED